MAYQIVVTSNRKDLMKDKRPGGFFKALGGLVVLFVSLLPDEDEDEDDHFYRKATWEGNPTSVKCHRSILLMGTAHTTPQIPRHLGRKYISGHYC